MEVQIKDKSLEMITLVEESVPKRIRSDRKRFTQVLFNLVGNALKFTFKGSVGLRLYYEKEYLFTEVSDTGVGIDE